MLPRAAADIIRRCWTIVDSERSPQYFEEALWFFRERGFSCFAKAFETSCADRPSAIASAGRVHAGFYGANTNISGRCLSHGSEPFI
jgi:hypothetical protein